MGRTSCLVTTTALLLSIMATTGTAAASDTENALAKARAGATTVVQVCSACHSLKYITFRDLLRLGFSQQSVDELRGTSEMADSIPRQTPEDIAKETYGVVPPDLSLMALARENGDDYIYRMLTGFFQSPDGKTGNRAYPGTRMPDILGIGSASDPETRAQIEQTAHDATRFLEWAADPHAAERRTLGYYVLTYLVLLTGLLYLLKREIWKDVP